MAIAEDRAVDLQERIRLPRSVRLRLTRNGMTLVPTVTGDFGEKIEIPVEDQTLVLDSSEFRRVASG
ncbi:hypothetical protein [Streptomyces cucumeris]|uniref:hypothetical protein n=1 Tax=Streptomyces cucumeris TaxID=2962890 RepID=UPI003D73A060